MPTTSQTSETFQSLFFSAHDAAHIRVPDYQRAYSWEPKQVDLFLSDLDKYAAPGRKYYFGHFIVEAPLSDAAESGDNTQESPWEIVDGQQRLTTLVLFLRVCQFLADEEAMAPDPEVQRAFSLIRNFQTVSYDADAFTRMGENLAAYFQDRDVAEKSKQPSDELICTRLGLDQKRFTHSQKRMALALRRFYQAFEKGVRPKNAGPEDLRLKRECIPDYIRMMLGAHCSCHRTRDKAVAVHIFEMHNTRGVPLTPLEILKAKLMKFVYDKSPEKLQKERVQKIQDHFGSIYAMEEGLAAKSFRGQMTMQQLLQLHLQVVDDGSKALPKAHEHEQRKQEHEFCFPADNAEADALIAHVENRLHHHYDGNQQGMLKTEDEGVLYALDLARELEASTRIVSQTLPQWDGEEPLVGDVLILERKLSCQFFLVACRRLSMEAAPAVRHYGHELLRRWERLLFTRDFHGAYHGKHYRDNFPRLFAEMGADLESMEAVMDRYLKDGFRSDTRGLQGIVARHLSIHKEKNILMSAYGWWLEKMKYVLYKFELPPAEVAGRDAHIRKVMKGTISVEHILPQDWQTIKAGSSPEEALQSIAIDEQAEFIGKVDSWINGLGNLLLLMPGENSSESNKHPADKKYSSHLAGSYEQHRANKDRWLDPRQWTTLIETRGNDIYRFMLDYFDIPAAESSSALAA
ncbi:DUF262 domain-containing protein [Prosthecobacter sp.]|uniref:DUF262 domain-containing protein n=1 Tax=Prosthecobacter sp. TaxID=1965333 RepID=UPI003783ED29